MVNVTECSSIGHITEHAFIGAGYRRLHTIAHRQQLMLRPTFSVFVSTFFLQHNVSENSQKYIKNKYDWMQTFSKTIIEL